MPRINRGGVTDINAPEPEPEESPSLAEPELQPVDEPVEQQARARKATGRRAKRT